MRRNIVYESECGICNPPGSRKEADKMSLAEKKGYPSLYVGESSRSEQLNIGEMLASRRATCWNTWRQAMEVKDPQSSTLKLQIKPGEAGQRGREDPHEGGRAQQEGHVQQVQADQDGG